MVVDISQLPTIERARRTYVLTAQEWSDSPDGSLQAIILHIGSHARRPDPSIASLAHVDIAPSEGRTTITGISPLREARRILAATHDQPCRCGWHDLDEPHHA